MQSNTFNWKWFHLQNQRLECICLKKCTGGCRIYRATRIWSKVLSFAAIFQEAELWEKLILILARFVLGTKFERRRLKIMDDTELATEYT